MTSLASVPASNNSDPYQLRAALLRLDVRVRVQVEAFRHELAERARDPFRGLYICDADVDGLLAPMPATELARRFLSRPASETGPRFARLAALFGLDAFEQEALLICLAPEVDLRYERLYAYLQDDVTRKRPTPDLVLRLLGPTPHGPVAAREALGPGGILLQEGLLVAGEDTAPLLARPLRIDDRVAEYLLGSDRPDPRIAAFTELVGASSGDGSCELDDQQRNLARLLSKQGHEFAGGPVIYLHGPVGIGKRTVARAICRAAGRHLLLLDGLNVLAARHIGQDLGRVMREALLQDAVLCVGPMDALLGEHPDAPTVRAVLRRALLARRGPTLLLGDSRWEPAVWLPEVPTMSIELHAPGHAARVRLWRRHINGSVPPAQVTELAARYRLDEEAIRAVAAAARGRSLWRGADRLDSEDLQAATRAVVAPPMDGLARRIEPRYTWEDIVLQPDGVAQLREVCARARYQALVLEDWGYGRKHARRAGLTCLFAGQPGTGKTMSAEIIAGDLGLELYRIDLSAVVSKYIGETEKNLEKIFRAADQGDAVLLFDEADALFGKRSEVRDAHDRYANVEIAYLLQRLEAYQGVAILTTNLRGNIDEAFLRRLDCMLEFPLPEEPERLAIWRRSLPPEAPLGEDIDLGFLARKFKLAGGHIHNIGLTAAYLAAADGEAIGMKHLVRGTRREYQKLSKLVAAADFEHYYPLLKEAPSGEEQ